MHRNGITEIWTGQNDTVAGGELPLAAAGILAACKALRDGFPSGFVQDPVIDITFTIFIAQSEDRAIDRSMLENMVDVAPHAARRWVTALVDQDILRVVGDLASQSAVIALTPKGLNTVANAVRAVIRAQQAIHGPPSG